MLQSDLRFRLWSSQSETRDVGYGCGDLVTLLEQPADQRMMHIVTPTPLTPTVQGSNAGGANGAAIEWGPSNMDI